MLAVRNGSVALLLILAIVCALLLPVAALAETTITDDQNFQGNYEIRNAEKIAAGTTYIGNMGSIAHIYKSGVSSIGTPQLLIGSANGANYYATIGFGWTNSALNYAPVTIGEICQSGSWPTVGDFFVATRDSLSDVAPTERMRVTYDGKVVTRGTGMVVNEDGADADFRVEGDTNANLLFVDASTDRVGIGTNTPSVQLHNTGDFITMGPYVDVRGYASFSAAITAIGASQKTLLIPNAQSVASSMTVPTNVHLWFLKGGSLSIASGQTVSIAGPLTAPIAQIFSFADTDTPVKFGATGTGYTQNNYVDKVYPQWWGAKGDWNTDDTVAVQAAVNSYQTYTGGTFANGGLYPTGGTVFFPVGTYRTTATINLHAFLELAGASMRGSVIRQDTASTNTPVLKGVAASNIIIHDLSIETYQVAPSGNHGLCLTNGGVNTGLKYFLQRVTFDRCYNAIDLSGSTDGSSMRDIYINRAGNDGIHTADASQIACCFDTIYVHGAGGCGVNMEGGASMSTFNNVICEQTVADGMKISASKCTFNDLYLGDNVASGGGNALTLNGSVGNTFHGLNLNGAGSCQNSVLLDASYGNTFIGGDWEGACSGYSVKWQNTYGNGGEGAKVSDIMPNTFEKIMLTWGGQQGVCNDKTYVVLRDILAVPDPYDMNQTIGFRPYELLGDTVTVRTRDVPVSTTDIGYGAPDPQERWTFFRNFPGVPNYSFMARGNEVMGVFPAVESLGSSLVTGDSCNFEGGTQGNWIQTSGQLSIVNSGYGGGKCMRLQGDTGVIARATLPVTTTAGKLYKLTYRYQYETAIKAHVCVFNSTEQDDLAQGPMLGPVAGWREDTMYFIAADTNTQVCFYIHDNNGLKAGKLDEIYVKEVKSAGSLQITGGRQAGTYNTIGGGGTISVYGNDHASKPGVVEIDGVSTAVLVNGTEGLKFSPTGMVINETGANADIRIEGDTNANLFVTDASADSVGIGTATPGSILHVAGPITTATRSVSSTTTLTGADSKLFVSASAGAVTVNLPAASASTVGREYHIYKTDSSANAVTVTRAGANTVNGTTSVSTTTQWKQITVVGLTSTSWIASVY